MNESINQSNDFFSRYDLNPKKRLPGFHRNFAKFLSLSVSKKRMTAFLPGNIKSKKIDELIQRNLKKNIKKWTKF